MKSSDKFQGFIFRSLLLLTILCSGKLLFAQVNEDYFEVTNTTYESWSGGMYGSGSSASYTFVLKFKKDASIAIDTIWFGDEPKLASDANYANGIKGDFKKNDLVVVIVRFSYPGENSILYKEAHENKKTYKNPLPNCNCIALLQFYSNNARYYYGVKKIDKEIDNEAP